MDAPTDGSSPVSRIAFKRSVSEFARHRGTDSDEDGEADVDAPRRRNTTASAAGSVSIISLYKQMFSSKLSSLF